MFSSLVNHRSFIITCLVLIISFVPLFPFLYKLSVSVSFVLDLCFFLYGNRVWMYIKGSFSFTPALGILPTTTYRDMYVAS